MPHGSRLTVNPSVVEKSRDGRLVASLGRIRRGGSLCRGHRRWRLLKADAPLGVAYVTFASFAGVMLLYLLIDTGRLADIPALRLGNALYRLEQVERQVRNLQTSLMGYETEEFPPGSYEVTGTPQDRRHPFRITFALKHSAVPDSVWVFENDAPISPKRFDVEDKRVAVRSPVDPRTQNNDYVIRYFQTPTGFGAGAFGAGEFGAGSK